MHLNAANYLFPVAAGVFLMIAPRVVSFAVAVYLIIVGMFGLNGNLSHHQMKWRGTEAPPSTCPDSRNAAPAGLAGGLPKCQPLAPTKSAA
jgi:hypothetical protein